jgi:hypothetical protein
LENYTITVERRIGEISIDSQEYHVLMVRLEKENEIKSYLIDVDNWAVLQSSQIKYSGLLTDKQRFLPCEAGLPPEEGEKGRWFHNALFCKRAPR